MKKIFILVFLAGLFCIAGTAMATALYGTSGNATITWHVQSGMSVLKLSVHDGYGDKKGNEIIYLGNGRPKTKLIDFVDMTHLHINSATVYLFGIPTYLNLHKKDAKDGETIKIYS